MLHYLGLDVSLKQTSICVVNETGSVVRVGVVDPDAIVAFVRSNAPGMVRVGLEPGPTATWLWTELKRRGLPVICIDARHAKAVLKMQINKSDRKPSTHKSHATPASKVANFQPSGLHAEEEGLQTLELEIESFINCASRILNARRVSDPPVNLCDAIIAHGATDDTSIGDLNSEPTASNFGFVGPLRVSA
jgi:hypothetical protein